MGTQCELDSAVGMPYLGWLPSNKLEGGKKEPAWEGEDCSRQEPLGGMRGDK